jgi:hypothetical protein
MRGEEKMRGTKTFDFYKIRYLGSELFFFFLSIFSILHTSYLIYERGNVKKGCLRSQEVQKEILLLFKLYDNFSSHLPDSFSPP